MYLPCLLHRLVSYLVDHARQLKGPLLITSYCDGLAVVVEEEEKEEAAFLLG